MKQGLLNLCFAVAVLLLGLLSGPARGWLARRRRSAARARQMQKPYKPIR